MKPIVKQIIISILLLLTTALSFYWLSVIFFKDVPFLNPFIFFLISFLLCATFLIFSALSSFKLWWQIFIYLLNSLLILLFFKFNNFIAFGVLSFFLFSFFASKVVQDEKDVFLKFKFFRIAQKGTESFFTGLALLTAVLIFLSPRFAGGELIFPRALFNAIWPQAEVIFSKQLPGFSGEMTVDDFIFLQIFGSKKENPSDQNQYKTQQFFSLPFGGEKIELELGEKLGEKLEEQIRKQVEEQLKNLSEEEKKRITQEMLKQGRDQFSQLLGRELKGDEKIKDVFYEILSSQFSKAVEPYKKSGTVGLIFILFLITRMLSTFLLYIFLPISYILFLIFKKIRFFQIKIEKADKEVLTI